jgi:hypothetical protein
MKKILIAKPSWPTDHPHYLKFWELLTEVMAKKDFKGFTIETLPVRFGLHGVHQFEKVRIDRNTRYDLYIQHHARQNYPNSIDFKPAYYNNLWYFDNNGYSGYSDLAELIPNPVPTDRVVDNFYTKYIEPLAESTKYASKNLKPLETGLPTEFVLIATQVEKDTVMRLKYRTTVEMIDRVVTECKKIQMPVVIKQHPMAAGEREVNDRIRRLIQMGHKVYTSNANICKLLDRAAGVAVVNSGVGFENLIRLKPTFTFGKSDYNQITQVLPQTLNFDVDKQQIKRYLYTWWQEIIDISREDDAKSKMFERIKSKL